MRNVISLFIVTGCFALPASAQVNCPEIDNDIARLACFDAREPSVAPVTLTLEEAFTEFYSFAADPGLLNDYGHISLDFRVNDCIFEGSRTEYTQSYDRNDRLRFQYVTMNLRHSDLVSPVGGYPTFVQVSQDRGHAVRLIDAFLTPPEALPIPGSRSIDIARSINSGFEGNFEYARVRSERTLSFPIVMESEDGAEAIDRFQALVSACRQ